MKLSIRKESPHYHDCVSLVDKVFVNAVPYQNCVTLDTKAGKAVIAKIVNTPHLGPQIDYETICGDVKIQWRSGNREYNDWVEKLIQDCEVTHGSR